MKRYVVDWGASLSEFAKIIRPSRSASIPAIVRGRVRQTRAMLAALGGFARLTRADGGPSDSMVRRWPFIGAEFPATLTDHVGFRYRIGRRPRANTLTPRP